jgi:LysM repeat protein
MPLVFNSFAAILPLMRSTVYGLGLLLVAGAAPAQSPGLEMANLREDVRALSQRVGELALRVEQLERENLELRGQARAGEKSYATLAQLNDAVTELNRQLNAAVGAAKAETLQQVAGQMEKLARQTNAAIESVAKGGGARGGVFAEDYPKEGISYTVQKGDSLAAIAKKTGARQQDIINANKLSDPSRITAGQTLFIPGGK